MTRNMLLDQDVMYFAGNPERTITIREPRSGERAMDFLSLGFHLPSKRRILVWKAPKSAKIGAGEIVRIPFVMNDGEVADDTEESLTPILREFMQAAALEHNIKPPKTKIVRKEDGN